MTLTVIIALLAALCTSLTADASPVRQSGLAEQKETTDPDTVVVITVPLTPCAAVGSDTETLVIGQTNLPGSRANTAGYIPDFYIELHEVSVDSFYQFVVSMMAIDVSFFDGHRVWGPHPVVGDAVPWLILRSTHGCIARTSASTLRRRSHLASIRLSPRPLSAAER